MNDYDSEKLAEVFKSFGLQRAQREKDADIILVNTCIVRQHAEDRATGYISSLKRFTKKKPNIVIAVCGCMVPEPERNLKKKFPHVKLFIPPNSPEKLVECLQLTPFPPLLIREGETERSEEGVSFVTIMHGCNNFCSYCVVPYVRGREISRPMDEVLAEIKQKIEQGASKIMLLGQNVNSYQYGLANLLCAIEKLSPLFLREGRLSKPNRLGLNRGEFLTFMTSHPKDISDEIIQAVHDLPYVIKDFHLPLQSGDDTILKAMNRGYTVDYFRDRVKKIRSLLPSARISTDILVGFPGETEEQFQNTLNFIKEIGFTSVNMFAYSSRPQTAASKLPNQLSEEIKQERLQRLIKLVRSII